MQSYGTPSPAPTAHAPAPGVQESSPSHCTHVSYWPTLYQRRPVNAEIEGLPSTHGWSLHIVGRHHAQVLTIRQAVGRCDGMPAPSERSEAGVTGAHVLQHLRVAQTARQMVRAWPCLPVAAAAAAPTQARQTASTPAAAPALAAPAATPAGPHLADRQAGPRVALAAAALLQQQAAATLLREAW